MQEEDRRARWGEEDQQALQARYQRALDYVVEQLEADAQVLAAMVYGSMAFDGVWIHSDIDLDVVVKDQKLTRTTWIFQEEEVVLCIGVCTRAEFITHTQGMHTASFGQSVMRNGRLVVLKDETLRPYFEDITHVGKRDRDMAYLEYTAGALWTLNKAEKWLYKKKEIETAQWWLGRALEPVAHLEVLRQLDVPKREILRQAQEHNPAFFGPLIHSMLHGWAGEDAMGAAIDACRAYVREDVEVFFGPVLAYMRENPGAHSVSALVREFQRAGVTGPNTFEVAMPWLCAWGKAGMTTLPARLTPKSRGQMNEAAYFALDD